MARSMVFAAVFCGAVYLGRLTVMDGTSLSLVWPAAGVATLWMAVQRRARTAVLDYTALAVATFTINLSTGATPALAACFVAANLAQVHVFGALLQRMAPHLWGAGGRDPLTGMGTLVKVIAAALSATGAGACIGPVAVWALTGHWSWLTFGVWITRNTVAVLLITTVGFRIGCLLATRTPTTHPSRPQAGTGFVVRLPFQLPRGVRLFELCAALVCSAGAYTLVFGALEGLPVAFPLIGLTVWVALRFDTTIVVVHDLLVGTAAVLLTLHGAGPLAAIADDATRGLVVQAYVGMVALIGLALALGRDERDLLLARVRHHADQATTLATHTQLLADASRSVANAEDPRTAVCAAAQQITGADGVYLLEPDGHGALVTTAVTGQGMPPVSFNLQHETSRAVTAYASTGLTFIPDMTTDPGVSGRTRTALHSASGAFQPVLTTGDTPLAVLALIWREHIEALPHHVPAMLQTLSGEAAHAIERGDLLLRLAQAADRDMLTGLPNRRSWDQTITTEIARATRTGDPLTLALIDLDHFKRYNDTLGHLAGDELLRAFAHHAATALRETDTLARWGGEEFVLALPDCTAADARIVADRIRGLVPHGQTCTIGIAQWHPGHTPADTLTAADRALYAGKNAGRNTTTTATTHTPTQRSTMSGGREVAARAARLPWSPAPA